MSTSVNISFFTFILQSMIPSSNIWCRVSFKDIILIVLLGVLVQVLWFVFVISITVWIEFNCWINKFGYYCLIIIVLYMIYATAICRNNISATNMVVYAKVYKWWRGLKNVNHNEHSFQACGITKSIEYFHN